MNPALTFWLLVFVLVATTLAALLWPLLRARHAPRASAADSATAIYRDQKRALDADVAAGAITPAERDAAVNELASRLGSEVATPAPSAPAAISRSRWIAALLLVGLIPATALILYAVLGNPEALRSSARATPPAGGEHKLTQQEIGDMVESLARKMEANPENAEGWLLLARSYTALGRFDDAARAYAQGAKRSPESAALYADWADALAMAQGRRLAGEPEELVARALKIDPSHKKSLALAATAALERRDFDTALGHWRRLQTLETPGSEQASQVAAVIAEVEAARANAPPGAKASSAPPGRAASPGPTAAAAAPRPSIPAPAAGTSAAAADKTLRGVVELAPAMKGRMAPDDTLYIFARTPGGSRAPLAVFRGSARDLPKTFLLDDTMGMAPGVKLSGAPEVVVEARVSKSGNALPQPGDLFGRSGPVAPGASGVRIVIDQAVP